DEFIPTRRVPDVHGTVPSRDRQAAAVWRPLEERRVAPGRIQFQKLFGVDGIPHANRAVRASRSDPPTVWRPRHGMDRGGVQLRTYNLVACWCFPGLDEAILIPGRGALSVCDPGDGQYRYPAGGVVDLVKALALLDVKHVDPGAMYLAAVVTRLTITCRCQKSTVARPGKRVKRVAHPAE